MLVKYENILFVNESPTSPIKLIDFGLSKVYYGGGNRSSSEESPSSTTASTKSKAKSSGTGSGGGYLTEGVGTIYTMAPEVLKGSYTNDADVWSVGVIAYMLLSSQMPFYGRKRQVIVEQILAGKYDFRGRRWRRISEPAKAFVRDLLVVDPAERLDADRASSAVWLNKRFAATTRGPKEQEIRETQKSLLNYAGYTKLKKMAMMVVAHRSTCEEIGILRKVFQKYANDTNNNINDQDPASSSSSKGCITYKEFCIAWKESGLPPEDTRAIFNAVVRNFCWMSWRLVSVTDFGVRFAESYHLSLHHLSHVLFLIISVAFAGIISIVYCSGFFFWGRIWTDRAGSDIRNF